MAGIKICHGQKSLVSTRRASQLPSSRYSTPSNHTACCRLYLSRPWTVTRITPSPKRRRTSSHNSSASSSRQSTPAHLHASQSPRDSPDTTSHKLPLRRASSGGIRGGGVRPRYRDSVSRDGSPYPDESDEDNRRAYWRHASPPRRQRQRSRRRDSSDSTPRSTSTHSSVETSNPEPRAYSPRPAPWPKTLHFKPLLTLDKAHARGITCLKFSPDGSLLATSSANATIHIYAVSTSSSPETLTLVKTFTGHLAGISALSWSPSGPPYTLASALDDKSILLWSPSSTTSSPSTPTSSLSAPRPPQLRYHPRILPKGQHACLRLLRRGRLSLGRSRRPDHTRSTCPQ